MSGPNPTTPEFQPVRSPEIHPTQPPDEITPPTSPDVGAPDPTVPDTAQANLRRRSDSTTF